MSVNQPVFPPVNLPVVVIEAGGGFNSPQTTKGDFIGFGSAPARLPVGTDGFLLEADSTQALGVGWSTRDYNLNNNNLFNAKGLVVGSASFPTVTGSQGIVSPILATAATYTATYSNINVFHAPILEADTITVSGTVSAAAEAAALSLRPNFTFSDGFANEIATGIDMNVTTSGTNTLGSAFGCAPVLTLGTNCTQAWGVSTAIEATSSKTITTATLFRGLTLTASGGVIQNIVGLDLNVLGTSTVSTWAIQVGPYPSYYRGTLLVTPVASPAVPTALAGGGTLSSAPLITTSGAYTATLIGAEYYMPWLVNDTITTAGAVANAQLYGLGVFPKVTASSSTTGLTAAGIACSPTFAGTDTYGTIYGLTLSATITATATAAVGIQSNMLVTGGTTTTLTGFKFSPTVFGGTVTTCVGLDLTGLAGSTIWGMKVGNYQSYHQGPLTLGGTSAPSWGLDIQAAGTQAAIGMVNSLLSTPASPAASNGTISFRRGNSSGHDFIVIQYNAAGTQHYLYSDITNNPGTWVGSLTAPT